MHKPKPLPTDIESTNQKMLDDIHSLRERVKQRLSHKISIVQNMSSTLENVTKKLDSDITVFETELRGVGEFETVKGISPNTEVQCVIL